MLKNNFFRIATPLFLFFFGVQTAYAGFLDDAGMSPECMDKGRCSFDDVALGFISLIKLLLGAIAALALVFMIWGGVQWVWSGGNADKVKRGKDIFFNTIAALVLAFGSYMITAFFINDILQPQPENGIDYRVSSEEGGLVAECHLQEVGTQCRTSQINYVCTGPDGGERCVPECNLPAYISSEPLDAVGLAFDCRDIDQHPNAAHYTGLCPQGEEIVCVLFDNSGYVTEEELDANTDYKNALMLLEATGWPDMYR